MDVARHRVWPSPPLTAGLCTECVMPTLAAALTCHPEYGRGRSEHNESPNSRSEKRRGSAPMIPIHSEAAYSPLVGKPPMKKAMSGLAASTSSRNSLPDVHRASISDTARASATMASAAAAHGSRLNKGLEQQGTRILGFTNGSGLMPAPGPKHRDANESPHHLTRVSRPTRPAAWQLQRWRRKPPGPARQSPRQWRRPKRRLACLSRCRMCGV